MGRCLAMPVAGPSLVLVLVVGRKRRRWWGDRCTLYRGPLTRMVMRPSSMVLGRALLPTPFSHQPVALPLVPSLRRLLREVQPRDEGSREEVVTAMLEKLPAQCDRVKKDMLHARYASRYYRSRYGRGLETRRKQLKKLLEMSDDEVRLWAQARCIPVRDPLSPP
ncbi:hypothetical protein TraAM80_01538 [Trypanosoma rangeli]|uniref:Uncharacterized protein n=1 Tax=Trypanosoma rangeli TaxID=5698 RepID=A0A3R7LAM0_TRYRA|nr:uncharacterized protein TraAM80_01538 [Trypanosoma rangeli]RNF10492.1 hypothetical protein TraAM80_01538 [Trypanosoma rangeli]|eukprot:RNF10492.1 hypothetical protein TraAM80_01538 [Trypanosoma rangeli]